MISPCYLTIATTRCGLIITRDTNGSQVKYYLQETSLVQTNIDADVREVDREWAGDDELLINAVERRECHYKCLKELDSHSVDAYFQTLQQDPVFNKDTIYSCVMCPSLRTYEAVYYA